MIDSIDFLSIHANFYDKDGNPFLVRCPKCKSENYIPDVASGICAWCGEQAEKQDDTEREHLTNVRGKLT